VNGHVRLLGAALPERNNEWTEANCCMELKSSLRAGNNKQHRGANEIIVTIGAITDLARTGP
jgi:hypothetical protein